MTIKQSIRKAAKQGNLIPAMVKAVRNNKVTVQLSNYGAVMRMLDITGGPVTIGQKVYVDFTTTPPVVIAPTPPTVTVVDGGARTIRREKPLAQQSSEKPVSNMIEVYSGPAPTSGRPATLPKATYNPNEAGLLAAIDICVNDDVIYLPACDISVTGTVNLPNLSSPGAEAAQRVAIVGVSRDDSVIRHGSGNFSVVLAAGCNATITDLSIIADVATNVYSPVAINCWGDAKFINCYIKSVNTGTTDEICVWNELSADMRFYNCTIIGGKYGVTTNTEGTQEGVDWIAYFQTSIYHGSTPDFPTHYYENIGYNRHGIQFYNDDVSLTTTGDFHYCGAIFGISLTPGVDRPAGYKIYLKAKYLDGTTSGSPLHITEDQSKWVTLGGSWPYSFTMINPADESPVEYINGLLDDLPYSNGDYVKWRWDNTTTSGSSNIIHFLLSRHSTYENPGQNEKFIWDEIYVLWPDGTREYIQPFKGHAYLESCFISSELYDLYAVGGSLIEVNGCVYDKSKTYGNILVWYNGHPGVLTSGSNLPVTTFPGMIVYQA